MAPRRDLSKGKTNSSEIVLVDKFIAFLARLCYKIILTAKEFYSTPSFSARFLTDLLKLLFLSYGTKISLYLLNRIGESD